MRRSDVPGSRIASKPPAGAGSIKPAFSAGSARQPSRVRFRDRSSKNMAAPVRASVTEARDGVQGSLC